MFHIQVFNAIDPEGLALLPTETYHVADNITDPDAILLRSQDLHQMTLNKNLLAIARAGAGTNNIPIEKCSQRGIPVFNTPGANANAVKELVIAGMLLACRKAYAAWHFTQQLSGKDSDIKAAVEKGKKQFVGFELAGRKLGVIGLGAIGVKVANAALALGMDVIGYDPQITVKRAWELSASVEQAPNVESVLRQTDFISVHVPLVDETKNFLNAERIALLQPSCVLINFSRDGIVDENAVVAALNAERLQAYVSDFPNETLLGEPKVMLLPHLGASTIEAQQNCSRMAVQQLRQYLETGQIQNSVNFPELLMPCGAEYRIAIVNANVPGMVAKISGLLGEKNINIIDLLNKSKGDLAYTVVDIAERLDDAIMSEIKAIDGVLSARLL